MLNRLVLLFLLFVPNPTEQFVPVPRTKLSHPKIIMSIQRKTKSSPRAQESPEEAGLVAENARLRRQLNATLSNRKTKVSVCPVQVSVVSILLI